MKHQGGVKLLIYKSNWRSETILWYDIIPARVGWATYISRILCDVVLKITLVKKGGI